MLFCPRDVELILRIPICSMGEEDRLIWHYIRNERFIVASTYKLAYQQQRWKLAGSSILSNDWVLIWKSYLGEAELLSL